MIKAVDLIEKFKYALADHWGYIWGTAGITWTEARQKQKVNYMISKYGENWKKSADAKNDNYYRAALYGAKWIGHMVADCSGMFVWAFKQYGMGMSHISSNIFKSYCSKKGKLNDTLKKTLLAGTAVFTGQTAGNHPHVGLYVGDGKVIEASGTEAGVCTSNITEKKWTFYGELKDVLYSASNATNSPSEDQNDNLPILKRGVKGSYVSLLQSMLKNRGYDLGSYGVDGDFGKCTESAVKDFQKDHGLTVDGVVGKNTWKSIMEDQKPVTYYTVIIPNLTAEKADELINLYPKATKEMEA